MRRVPAVSLETHPLLGEDWYYSIELAPGVWTRGRDPVNVPLIRNLLAGADLEGVGRAIDIGTQEALMPVLLKRRGVEAVVAYDRHLEQERLEFIQEALDVSFDLVGGLSMGALQPKLAKAGHSAFDVVVFSGVLYHMVDPLAGLCWARGLVRDGGLVLIETHVLFSDTAAVHLDMGRYYPWGLNAISVHALERMLGALGLQPLDALTTAEPPPPDPPPESGELGDANVPRGRLAVICRALPLEQRTFGIPPRDITEFVDLGYVASDAPPVVYEPLDGREPLTGAEGELHEIRGARTMDGQDGAKLALADLR